MRCCGCNNQNGASEGFACNRRAWMIAALAGAVILAFGVVGILSVQSGATGLMRNWMLRAAAGAGASPVALPVIITTIGAATILGAGLGYCHDQKNKE